MSLGHEDGAVRCDQHVVRLVEVAGCCCTSARAERHQELAVRAELEHLVAPGCTRRRTGEGIGRRSLRTRGVILAVGDPHVAIAIDEDAVREHQQSRAEALHELSRRIELQNRRQVRAGARVRTASFGDPDAATVSVDFNGARRAPFASLGQLKVVRDRAVGIRQRISRLRVALGVQRRHNEREQERRRQLFHGGHDDDTLPQLLSNRSDSS
jgi:hypothetical protein